MAFSLAFAHDFQRRLVKEDYEAAKTVIKRYQKEGALDQFLSKWTGRDERAALMTDFRDEFAELDTICRDWPRLLESGQKTLDDSVMNPDHYENSWKEFLEQNPYLESGWTQVFRYFLYSFMLSALYDKDVLTKMKMAVLCTMLIIELDFTDWLNGKRPDQVLHCYALARQVENSDENRRKLEEFLKQEKFSARRIINALAR